MENLKTIVANNLVLLRKKFGYKQSEVAEKLNYSDKTISKWENAEMLPSVENLIELCKLYNVTLDEITKEIEDDAIVKVEKDKYRASKLSIALLAISSIWIIATIFFVYAQIISNNVYWTVFVWAIPVSMILAIIFNSLWGNIKMNYVYISILLWSSIASIYLQFLTYNLIPLFFIGGPVQIAIVLWANIKKKK